MLCGLSHSSLLKYGQSALGPSANCQVKSVLPTTPWDRAIENGKKLSACLETKLADKCAVLKDNKSGRSMYYSAAYTRDITFDKDSPSTTPRKPFVSSLGIDHFDSLKFYPASVQSKFGEREAYFHLYSNDGWPLPGVIIANYVRRRGGPLHHHDATFYSWKEFSAAAENAAIDGLKYIVQESIDHPHTVAVISRAYKEYLRDHPGVADEYKPVRITPDQTSFNALLGTPNFAGYVKMLSDHAVALGHLKVVEIAIYPRAMALILGRAI